MKNQMFTIGESGGLEPVTHITLPMYAELKCVGAGLSDCPAAIFEEKDGNQYAVTMSDYSTPYIFTVDSYTRPLSKKFGIGRYYYDDFRTVDPAQILPYVEKARAAEQQRKEREALAAVERNAAIERGRVIFEENRPKDATHVIIASLRQDESDIQSDYFGYSSKRTIILAFSYHKRDIFSEMRKACLNCDIEEIRKHATTPEKPADASEWWSAPDEHREKYSMGSGYYLGESKYSGWVVQKTAIEYNLTGHYENSGRENGFCAFKNKQAATGAPGLPATTATTPGNVQIVDYSEKAIAVIGDTYPIRATLKELGGKWNKFLSCGAGWIFKKSDLEKVKTALDNV